MRFVLLVIAGILGMGCERTSKLPEGERWDTVFLMGSKIGHLVTTWQPAKLNDKLVVHWTQKMQLNIKRFGNETKQTMALESWESPNGQLIRCNWVLRSGETQTGFTITRTDNRLRIRDVVTKQSNLLDIDWQDSHGGYFAVEQSLLRNPMVAGQSRKMKVLMPVLNTVVDVRLHAMQIEPTETPAGPLDLLRIENVLQLAADNSLRSTLWADPDGRILKTYLPTMQQETYYTNRQTAQAEDTSQELDFGLQTIVPTRTVPSNIHQRASATYVVRLARDNPGLVFSHGVSQVIQSLDKNSAQIQVFGHNIKSSLSTADDKDQPTEMDLAESGLIQSTDSRIVALANKVFSDASSDVGKSESLHTWDVAVGLESLVHTFIQDKNFSRAFSSAVEVLESRQGDCTEHATLLAALCRARKIPARVAIGLVYSPRDNGFAYHMWNEVWTDDSWRPLDATLALGGIGAGHLKVAHSSLAGANAIGTLLPVIRILGKLEIEFQK